MQRHEHYIQRTKGESQPKAFVAVETESTLVPHPALANVEIEKLESWTAVVCIGKSLPVYTCHEESGRDALSFWDLIDKLLKRGQVLWVFSLPASRCLALLDFWEELEAGRVYLSERDCRDKKHRSSGLLPELRCRRDGDIGCNRIPSDTTLQLLRQGLSPCVEGNGQEANGRSPRPVGYCVLEDPPTIVQCRRKYRPGLLKWVDLRNYGFGGSTLGDGAEERAKEIAEIILSMIRTLADNGMGALQNTAASQAFYTWKHKYMTHPVWVHCEPDVLDLERRAYYGGRTEAGYIGCREGTIYHTDFRSFYPSIAAVLEVPVRLVGHADARGAEAACLPDAGGCCIAEVSIRSEEAAYPHRSRGITTFPLGQYWTVLSGPELAYAVERGHVVAVGRYAWYELAPALAGYSSAIQSLRRNAEMAGNKAGAEYLKRLNVSLFGKFAQTSATWVDTTERHADAPYESWWEIRPDGELERWRSVAWEVQREHKFRPGDRPDEYGKQRAEWCRQVLSRETGESCPAVSAFITSAGRMRLWDAICTAGGRNVLYCDTDSLFLTAEGFEKLLSAAMVGNGEWGKLSLRATIARLDVRGYKHYIADGTTICSGIPRGQMLPGPDKNSYYLRAWIGRNLCAGRKPTAERARLVYQRQSAYLHGRITEGGKVEPLRIGP